MSVIVSQALQDASRWTKPVHRRVLHGMSDLGLGFNQGAQEIRQDCGEVLGKYHPHGDSSVYDTMGEDGSAPGRCGVILWSTVRGTLDRSMVTAPRPYDTESPDGPDYRKELLDGYRQGNCRFRPEFDDSIEYFNCPADQTPNLLINGASGIVGYGHQHAAPQPS